MLSKFFYNWFCERMVSRNLPPLPSKFELFGFPTYLFFLSSLSFLILFFDFSFSFFYRKSGIFLFLLQNWYFLAILSILSSFLFFLSLRYQIGFSVRKKINERFSSKEEIFCSYDNVMRWIDEHPEVLPYIDAVRKTGRPLLLLDMHRLLYHGGRILHEKFFLYSGKNHIGKK